MKKEFLIKIILAMIIGFVFPQNKSQLAESRIDFRLNFRPCAFPLLETKTLERVSNFT